MACLWNPQKGEFNVIAARRMNNVSKTDQYNFSLKTEEMDSFLAAVRFATRCCSAHLPSATTLARAVVALCAPCERWPIDGCIKHSRRPHSWPRGDISQ